MWRQDIAPLLEAMRAYLESGFIPFHTPGHKGGRFADPAFLELVGERALVADLSELPGLDNLHSPSGAILEAAGLASELFGADESFFLVNGSTAGVQAMVMATCGPGDALALQRDIHKSAVSALVLSGARPAFFDVQPHPEFGIPMPPSLEQVERTLDQHREVKAILVMNPSPYGLSPDLRSIVGLARSRGVALLVDEAWGPHFHFSGSLPPSAMEAGADACVQSLHKVLGALGQASLLHVRNGRVSAGRVGEMLGLLQTTSPSYLLMSSLDSARRYLAVSGPQLVSRCVDLCVELREAVRRIPGIRLLAEESIPAGMGLDVTKLVINVAGIGLTGHQGREFLARRFGIQLEFSDEQNLVALVTPADDRDSLYRLGAALRGLAAGGARCGQGPARLFSPPPLPPMVCLPREAALGPRRRVPLCNSRGCVSAETISVFPPGFVLVFPGELLTPPITEKVEELVREGQTRPDGSGYDELWVRSAGGD